MRVGFYHLGEVVGGAGEGQGWGGGFCEVAGGGGGVEGLFVARGERRRLAWQKERNAG